MKLIRATGMNGSYATFEIEGGDSMLEKKAGYEPIKIVKYYSLINLPDEDQFLKDLEPEEEDE